MSTPSGDVYQALRDAYPDLPDPSVVTAFRIEGTTVGPLEVAVRTLRPDAHGVTFASTRYTFTAEEIA